MVQLNREELRDEVFKITARLAECDVSDITPEDRLREDLGLDSLKSMELLSRITEKYDLEVEMEDVQDVKTVEDIVEFMLSVAG